MIRKVVLAISGGVDSGVAAYLLKKKGYNVTGLFLKNWSEIDETGKCTGNADYSDAQFICDYLEIPLHFVNFEKQYWNYVFENFLKDYQDGITPNPDILCNRHIKFNIFFNYGMKKLEGDCFATGHYAQSSFGNYLEHYEPDKDAKLLQAVDKFKDQTFFLSQINQSSLRKTMFPIGHLLKSEVKEIALNLNWSRIVKKRESTGVCFIGRRNFQEFISEYIEENPGDFVDLDTGQIVGKHKGIHNWTVGQRCCLGGHTKPYYVQSKDKMTRRIYVVKGTDHKKLFTNYFYCDVPIWISKFGMPYGVVYKCKFRFQHTKPLVDCTLYQLPWNQKLFVKLAKPLRALTPGQYAVFYTENECIGSARILKPGPSISYTISGSDT